MRHLLFITLTMLFASQALAQISGKNVVFVHGFQAEALNPALAETERQRSAREQAGTDLARVINDYVYYDSRLRLTANATDLFTQIKDLEQEGTCSQGCYFITASTGDLVTRYIISRLNQWGIDPSKFRILLSFDLVGAGGGTEGADALVGIAQGNPVSVAINSALSQAFFGITLDFGAPLGIINDLRPSIARNQATGNYNVPRLRIVGAQTTPIISQLFLTGGDDGIVPMHSACGSARQEAIFSCSRSIKVDGKLTSADGPQTLRYNHFPILMGKDMAHTEIDYRGQLVAVNNNRNFGPETFSVREKTRTTGWWIFKSQYRTVDKPDNQLATTFIINEFDD